MAPVALGHVLHAGKRGVGVDGLVHAEAVGVVG